MVQKSVWKIPPCIAYWHETSGASWAFAYLWQQARGPSVPFPLRPPEIASSLGKLSERSANSALDVLKRAGLITVTGKGSNAWAELADPATVLPGPSAPCLQWEVSSALCAWPRLGPSPKWFATYLWNEKVGRAEGAVHLDVGEIAEAFQLAGGRNDRLPREWVLRLHDLRLIAIQEKVKPGWMVWVHDPDEVQRLRDEASKLHLNSRTTTARLANSWS